MINTYAVVRGGEVINTILLDDSLYEDFPATLDFGSTLVLVTDSGGIGWKYDGQQFIAPEALALTAEEIQQQAKAYRDNLLVHANVVTDDWRAELALGIISDEDKATLIRWMNYIKAVKSTDISSAQDISWPEEPG
ncbi:tail fiber assembly protein [Rahnella inusitata]|uniref:tail fiber assembly protein n=1 Tax=Rahnella inusitata TaxID=58169 RepID=UPI0039BDAD4C